jgi:hypothetical protein
MQKKLLLLPLAIAVLLPLSGCQHLSRSRTWDRVVHSGIHTSGGEDSSKVYAEELHRQLAAEGVEHKLVTYQYRYRVGLRDETSAERTVVLYRDTHHPDHAWWLKDVCIGRPVWLPDWELARQLAFYFQHDVEVVHVKEYGGGDSKHAAPPKRHAANASYAPVRFATSTPQPPPGLDPDATFRKMHGTPFNSASAVDRAKMNAILRQRNR